MWVFPLLAALVAAAFTILLVRQFLLRRRPYQALWALALAMFAGASAMVFLGVLNGWTTGAFRVYCIPAYVVLVGGTLWSAWRMRGRPELRDRFAGTLAIAIGATVVAAGSAFAATGDSTGFSLTLAAGIAVMFYGFLRASRHGPARPDRGPSLENASHR